MNATSPQTVAVFVVDHIDSGGNYLTQERMPVEEIDEIGIYHDQLEVLLLNGKILRLNGTIRFQK